jgi:hypothetical protein
MLSRVPIALAACSEITTDVVERTAVAFVTIAIPAVTPILVVPVVAILTIAGLVVFIFGAFAKAAAAKVGSAFSLVILSPASKWFVVGS